MPNSATDAKTRLLEAGAIAFAEKGFKGSSVREICDRAGTGNNMIHHYFGNKQGLYDAIISKFSADVFSVPVRIMQKLPRTQSEFISRFELFVEETLEALIIHRSVFVLIQQDTAQATQNAFADYSEKFINFIEHGKKEGFVNESIDASMLTGLVMDRLGNQVIYADAIKRSAEVDLIGDEQYRERWLRANLNLFLHGFIA